MALIKVVKHDHVTQKISIEEPGPIKHVAAIPSNRKAPKVILNELKGNGPHGKFNIRNVGLSCQQAKVAHGKGFGKRNKCDVCQLLTRNTGFSMTCDWTADNVCSNCWMLFGRPCCSWTSDIPSVATGNTFADFEARNETANIRRREALMGLKGWRGDGSITMSDPVIQDLDEGNMVYHIDNNEWRAYLDEMLEQDEVHRGGRTGI